MTPRRERDPLVPPVWVAAVLAPIVGGRVRAEEVLGDLEELARRRRPRFPALFYVTRTLWLVACLFVARLGPNPHANAGSGPLFGDLSMDLTLTIRSLLRRPATSLTVVTTLGLAIGFNAAIYTVLEGIVLEPLPFPNGDRLVVVDEVDASTGAREDFSGLTLRDLRASVTRLSGLAGWRLGTFARTSDGGPPESLASLTVTDDLFEVLEVPARLGRTLLPGDDGLPVAVVSNAYWASNLGADPGVVGANVTLDGVPYEVVGVMPSGFRFPQQEIDVWVPASSIQIEGEHRGSRTWNAIGRLATGATPADAQSELQGVQLGLAERYPENRGWDVSVRGAGAVLRDAGNLPFLLAAAVTVVLLIACVNAANILFVRSLERTRDVAVRAALGASRGRLARLVLLEAAVLSLAACGVGLLGGALVVRVINGADPGVLPAWEPLALDWSVALFAVGLSAATALLAGLVPALHVARPGLATTLSEFDGRTSGGRVDRRVRNALVTAQVALTLVLVHGSILLTWSLWSVSNVDPGFEDNGVLTATAVLAGQDAELTDQYERIMERFDAIPGVVSAGTVSALPMNPVGGRYHADVYSVEFPDRTPVEDRPEVDVRVTSPGYLQTMGIELIDGRNLLESDRPDQPLIMLVNEELVRRYFPDRSAVGMHLAFAPGTPGWEIVGVVSDVRHDGLDAEPRAEVYIGFLQMPHNDMTFVIRTLGDPTAIVPAVRSAVAEVAPDIPLVAVNTLEAVVDGSLDRRRFNAAVFGSVAFLAILLASLGIYGVTSYSVSLRQRELGIRVTIGARRGHLLGSVLRGTLGVVLLGVGIGAVGALAGARYLEAQLFGVEATSAGALAVAAIGIVAVGLVGSLGPARRATRADPVEALRAG